MEEPLGRIEEARAPGMAAREANDGRVRGRDCASRQRETTGDAVQGHAPNRTLFDRFERPDDEREGRTMAFQLTLLDLVNAVSESATTDAEVVATVVHLVNSGIVQLCGNFRGARFELDTVGMSAAA